MKRIILCVILMIAIISGTSACGGKADSTRKISVSANTLKRGVVDKEYVELTKVSEDIWVHTTYQDFNGSRTPSNGVLAITDKGLVLIDTPWNNPQTKQLIELAKESFGMDFQLAVITHAHDDRIGGIDELLRNRIDTVSTAQTANFAEKYGFKRPKATIDSDIKSFKIGDTELEIFYPGEGHTADNITVWFPKEKVLFGGCLVKSEEATGIGNTKDANMDQWPKSVNKLVDRYPDAEVVIPGHGNWGNKGLLKHTLELLGND